MLLANENKVKINYIVSDFSNLTYQDEFFDAIAFIFTHFPGEQKAGYFNQLKNYLKPGGLVIFEALSKNHIKYQQNSGVGGPGDINMLYSIEEIETFFSDFSISEISESEQNFMRDYS